MSGVERITCCSERLKAHHAIDFCNSSTKCCSLEACLQEGLEQTIQCAAMIKVPALHRGCILWHDLGWCQDSLHQPGVNAEDTRWVQNPVNGWTDADAVTT